MRRRLQTLAPQWQRPVCSYNGLIKVQTALQRGKRPGSTAVSYADFFHIPISLDAGIEQSIKDYFTGVKQLNERQQETFAVRQQEIQNRYHKKTAILLLGFDYHSKAYFIFSIAMDKVVIKLKTVSDNWEVADDVLQYTNQVPHFVIIPVVTSEKERRVLAPHLEGLTQSLMSSGLQPVAHVDTLELAQSLEKDPQPLGDLATDSVSGESFEPLSDEWFRAHWAHLRAVACRSVDEDPIKTVTSYILPRYDVLVVHIVRAGSRGMNLAVWDTSRKRRFSAKGMLSDVLACLLSMNLTDMILIPTNRTDRASLFRCSTALTKAGHACVIVFASEINEKYRQVFHSDPYRYWMSLKEVNRSVDTDLVYHSRIAAGNRLRATRRKVLSDHLDKTEWTRTYNDDIATPTSVEKWMSVFKIPKRLAAEKAERRHYKQYLAISYMAADYTAHGQPSNPTSEKNYVVATAMSDSQDNVLEPWSVYTARGQFSLPILDEFDVLVVHDAKRFLLLLWNDSQLQKFLKRGGRVWCTMLAEYLLDAQRRRASGHSLGDMAIKYGFMLPPSSVCGSPADALPLAFHRTYLIKAVSALASIFKSQLTCAVAQAQIISLAHRMDSLLAMASMEHAGIHVDVDEAGRQSKAVRNRALLIDRTLDGFVPEEVPLDMRSFFDWGSFKHIHAYLFGGSATIGNVALSRHSSLWTSNLIHLCHKYGPFSQMVGELHLQRYAAMNGIPPLGKLPLRIAKHISETGSQTRKRYRVVLFDVETTGLNTATDEIIEVAMFDPVENTTFCSLVQPQRAIQPRTVSIHHITDAMVKKAPTMEVVITSIVEYLRLKEPQKVPDEVLILVGHNVFGIDEPMLRRALDLYSPETDHDEILFCDSLVLLQAQKLELQNAKMTEGSIDHGLLDSLSESLRLSTLIEKLRVHTDGQLHRADTDAKALWYVLLKVFGQTGKDPVAQRDAILTEAAKSLLKYPSVGCFVPSERKRNSITVSLPGVAHKELSDTRLVKALQRKAFNEEVLATLYSRGLKVAGLIIQRMRLEQHTSRFLHPSGDGHLTVLHADHCVRQHIDMTATTTSRTTSAFPSCQNIPKDDKSPVRRLFTSRFGRDGRCVEVDYSQLEIVVLAVLCNDKQLLLDINNGIDFHVKRAEFFSGLPYQQIYEGYKRGVPKYVALRKTAKQFSFQRLYGAGVPLLHKTTGIPVKDLESSIAAENATYPGIAAFHRMTRAVALRPNNPGLPAGFIVELPTGLRMSFKARDVILNLPPLKNYPIQGYGAELAQMMLGRLFRHFVAKDFYKQKAFLTNFVHDSVWLDCHVDVLEECVRDVCRILSEVHLYVPKKFPGVEIGAPLKVSASCGVDMCSMHSVDRADFSFVRSQKRGPRKEVDLLAGMEETLLVEDVDDSED